MGPRLSLLAPSAPTVAISSYVDVLDGLHYTETINNSRFLKTVKASDRDGEVVLKIFIKPLGTGVAVNLQTVTELCAKQSQLLSHFPHCLGWSRLIETDRAGYLQRQWVGTNLYDRLSLRPFMEPVEKLFVVYQMLSIVRDLHQQLQIHHGDLKLENFMCTQSLWVVLTDFATYTKPTWLPEDNPNQFSFYFDTSARRVCYVAPERFYLGAVSPPQNISDDGSFVGRDQLSDAMDLFSLGCCIAELYADGEPTFTLSQLFKYIKGQFVPDLSSLEEVPLIKSMVQRLTSLDPALRPSAGDLLDEAGFPPQFAYLYEVAKELAQEKDADTRVDTLYSRFTDIMAPLAPAPSKPAKPRPVGPATFSVVPYRLPFPRFPEGDLDLQPALLLLNTVCACVKLVVSVPVQTRACELILALSEHVSDDNKLDRSLAYLCVFVDAYCAQPRSPEVVCTALACLTTLLMQCRYINPINVVVFPEYLLPKLATLATVASAQHEPAVMRSLAAVVPSLASVAKRFWTMSKTFKLREYDRGVDGDDPLVIPKEQLDDQFEALAFALLTHPHPDVRIALVHNILPLCYYFGIDKTDDTVLPHLITYLNDSNFALKQAFMDAIIAISPFIGVLTFEQYVLPLLLQTLGDPEPFVVLKVLEVFTTVVGSRLINPRVEFNALDVYGELLGHALPLLLHPVEWVRQSVLCLVATIAANLADADRYTFLYPLVRPYLRYDTTEMTWAALYPFLTRAVSRQVFEVAMQWSVAASAKSSFWSSRAPPPVSRAQMGKSVYLPRTATASASSSLSPEDKHWIYKLRSVGFDDRRDLWKLSKLKHYIHTQARNRRPPQPTVASVDVPPHNIFFDIAYKSEPLASAPSTTSTAVGDPRRDMDSRSMVDDHGGLSLVFPNRTKASLQTSAANVYGELDLSHESVPRLGSSSSGAPSRTTVVKVTDDSVITASIKCSYSGADPYINNYLESLRFEPGVDNFPEFGVTVPTPTPMSPVWQPQGRAVARIPGPEPSDGLAVVAVCPSHEFFVTGSDAGVVTVWDTNKLEKLVSQTKTATASVGLGAAVTGIRFLPHRFAFVVTTADAMVRVVRVGVLRGKNRRIQKFTGLSVVRSVAVPAVVADFGFFHRDDRLMIAAVCTTSVVLVIDVCDLDIRAQWCNRAMHGLPTSIAVGDDAWALVATDAGRVCLWDLRFGLQVRVYRVKRARDENIPVPVSSVVALAPSGGGISFALVCQADVTVWEMPSLECRQVMGPRVSWDRRYQLLEVETDIARINLAEVFDTLATEPAAADGPTVGAAEVVDNHMVVSVGKTVMCWNLESVDDSVVVNNDGSLLKNTPAKGQGLLKEYVLAADSERLRNNHDIITGVCITTVPYNMIVTIDRIGDIHLYT
ncbi:serine/threonine-protein kinase Vps15p [Diutina catenulata]